MDSIDVELSKPSTNKEAQAYCATVISNLEGWRGIALPGGKEGGQITIIQLDTRVRRLENIDGINPPPPMDMPSWDSLSWRVARLHRKMPQGPISRKLYSTPPHITATLELLRSTVASIGGVGPQSWAAFIEKEESLEGDGLVQAAAQFLCYLAGKRGYKTIGSFGLQPTCTMALDLSLDVDASGPKIIQVNRPRSMGAIPQVPLPVQKACCGCCGCYCHKSSGPKPSVLSWATKKYYKEKRASRTGVKARIAGVFRRLAFWKRRCEDDTDSDASSTTTSSSSTIA
ncbi:hypothetical protein EV127DRAFT_344042 [Xylaria flabelliformis]|nr:hypothetical protein EV127DRAFT_344042 [Xylaria flabelliformis]